MGNSSTRPIVEPWPVYSQPQISGFHLHPPKPKIAAAAIRMNSTVVFTGPHHHIIIHDIVQMGYAKNVGSNGEQGFLTSTNEFVNREEAGKIAIAAGQISSLKYSKTDLYSEELWQVKSHWSIPAKLSPPKPMIETRGSYIPSPLMVVPPAPMIDLYRPKTNFNRVFGSY